MRLIDADALLKGKQDHELISTHLIWNAPTIEIVRCKDCKYGQYRADYDDYGCYASRRGLVHDADFYCADGERREP